MAIRVGCFIQGWVIMRARKTTLNRWPGQSSPSLLQVFIIYLLWIQRKNLWWQTEGIGEDCHRTWEAVLLGSIPIVRHSGIDSLFQDSPIFVLGIVYQIDRQYLTLSNYSDILKWHISDEWNITYKTPEKFLGFSPPNLSKKHAMAQYWFDRINAWRDK